MHSPFTRSKGTPALPTQTPAPSPAWPRCHHPRPSTFARPRRLYPEQLKLENVRTWAHDRLESGLAVASVHRELDTLSAVYGEALRSGEITMPQSPFRDPKALALPKIKNERQSYLPPDKVGTVSNELGPWWPYAEFTILTGLRFGNLAGLRWPDIDWLSQLAHLWETKSDKQFSVELCDRAIALLRAQHATWGESSEWCWPNSKGGQLDSAHFRQRVWSPAFKRAGLVDLVWHDLRHTTATWMAQAGVDLFTVQGLLDHQDHRTTQRYAKHSKTRGRAGLEVLEKLLTGVSNPSVSLEKGGENCLPVTI